MQRRWFLFFFAVMSVFGVTTLMIYARAQPHGCWDAWAIWNMHARILYRADDWQTLFRLSPLTHPDYPVLLPTLVALLWALTGHETLLVPAAVSLTFTITTGMLLFLTVRIVRGTPQAALATLLLVGTSTFLSAGATQYADIPFGTFVLATLTLLTLTARIPQMRWLPVLAGVLAGCAVWTKNEGLLFVGIVALVVVGFWMGRQMSAGSVARFALGVAPFLVGIAYVRWFLSPPNDLLTTPPGVSLVAKMFDPARYLLVAKLLVVWLPRFGRGVLVLLVVYAVLLGRTPQARRSDFLPLIVSSLVFAGYFAIYIITPYDVAWHIETSILRLLLHLWPSILFGVFLVIRTPAEMQPSPDSTAREPL